LATLLAAALLAALWLILHPSGTSRAGSASPSGPAAVAFDKPPDLPWKTASSKHGGAAAPGKQHRNHIFSGGPGGAAAALEPCPARLLPGSWMGGAGAAGYRAGGALPLTSEAQRVIFDNQHPTDCSAAKYLVFGNPTSGLGSILHQLTVGLALAVDSGRVFIEANGSGWADGVYCKNSPRSITGCYMEPAAGCAPSAAQLAAAVAVAPGGPQMAAASGPTVVRLDMSSSFAKRTLVPKQLLSKLKDLPILEKHRHYWWRAQGIAYLVRPSQRTLAALAQRERSLLRGRPPAPGCVSLYVRRGDKAIEAPVFSDEEYANLTRRLVEEDPSLRRQVGGFR
jgi:hypothetical protein